MKKNLENNLDVLENRLNKLNGEELDGLLLDYYDEGQIVYWQWTDKRLNEEERREEALRFLDGIEDAEYLVDKMIKSGSNFIIKADNQAQVGNYLNDVKGYLIAGLLEQYIIYSDKKERLLNALDEMEA